MRVARRPGFRWSRQRGSSAAPRNTRAAGSIAGVFALLIATILQAGQTPGPGIDWRLTPDRLQAECVEVTARTYTRVRAVADGEAPEEGNLERLLAIETAIAEMRDALAAHTLLATTAPEPGLRETAGECRAAVERLTVNIAAHPVIYTLAARAGQDAEDPVDRQLARVYQESGRRAGAQLEPEKRRRLTSLMEQLGRVQQAFQRGLAEDRTTIRISEAEAGALPVSLRLQLMQDEDGYAVPVVYGAVNRQFMARMTDGAARERYQVAFLNRGGQGNLDRVQQALALRREIAGLAGFPSWADYRLDTLMARKPDRAMGLVRRVDTALFDKADAEIAALEALKKERGDPTPFAAWDYGHYQPMLERERYGVDDAEVRRYFPVSRVVPGVLDIYARLFALEFERLPSGDDAWAPGVQLYAISEADGGAPFAFFYLDLAQRPGKFLSPASYPIRAGRRLADGGYRRPVSAIIGNGPVGGPDEPALFGHAGLVQFFHEFGHVMHTTLSTARYASLYGANTRRDFVEAPSQMLENWVWQPEVLSALSSHVETGEPLPEDTVRRMAGLKRASTGVFWTRQAFMAAYDLTLHGPDPEVDANALWFELMPRLTPLPPTPGTMPPASFMPIMGGYEANYYGYLWSRVYAQDLFSVFAAEGIDDPAVGLRFRRRVLEPGGEQEPDALVRAFLGRPVSYDAFFEELGLE